MDYFVIGLALVAHLYFWGAGLAWWIVPRRWQMVWPLWIPVSGWVLQAAVVWGAAYLGLGGAQTWAWYGLVLPAALCASALRRGGRSGFWVPLRRTAALHGLVLLAGFLLVLPLALGQRDLTTVSLGSCDAADYAAGTRVFLEFARADRTGFLGLTEVVGLGSCDNFYDFWLRLNHFTPSAVCAMAAAVFRLDLHEVTGLVTVVFWATLPLSVFFFARVGAGLERRAALVLAWVTTLSPVSVYAVAHVAMAQLLATAAIALLIGVGLLLWRRRREMNEGWWAALVVTYSLLLGAYNFILLVAWTPAVAVVGWGWAQGWNLRPALRWAAVFFGPLALASLFWWGRAAGIVERFQLFQKVDFGWLIPLSTPEGWFGLIDGTDLGGMSLVARVALLTALLLVLPWAWQRALRDQRVLLVLLPLPALCGYLFLHARGYWLGTRASYDAYKILAVFLPMLLVPWAFAWQTHGRGRGDAASPGPWSLRVAFLVLSMAGVAPFFQALRNPPFVVTPETAALRALEARPDVSGINLRVDDFWTRLWSNAYLLRKPLYFATPTYEGRRETELRGSHDLQAKPLVCGAPVLWQSAQGQFVLRKAGRASVEWTDGWYDLERGRRGRSYWRWAGQHGELKVSAQASGVGVLEVELRSLSPREVHLLIGGRAVATFPVSAAFQRFRVEALRVPAGVSTWRFETDRSPEQAGRGDSRALGFALASFSLEKE